MRNFKRMLAILLAIMMVIPMTVISASADGSNIDNWVLFGGKYAAGTGFYMANKGATGFTMTENAQGGIDVHVPDKTEFGNNTANAPIAYVFCDTPTPLDNLSVTMKMCDDFNFSGVYANKVACAWTVDRPLTVEDIEAATGKVNSNVKTEYENKRPALCFRDDSVATNGFRALVTDKSQFAKGVLAQIDSSTNGLSYSDEFTGKVASRVSINLYDGEYTDCNDGYGYRWCFVAHNFEPQCPNGNSSGIFSINESINVSDGVTFEFIPDTTLGYIVTINGKEFCHGEEVGGFPNSTGQLDDVVDIQAKSEKYLTSMTYARADIDMTALVGEGNGYMLCGTAGRIEPDPKTSFTVVSVNGVPAAQWNGEANTHTHTWVKDEVNSIPATCTDRGYTFYKCACGAVKHPQIRTVLPADPAVMQSDDMSALLDKNFQRLVWEDMFPGNVTARENWYRQERYAILYKCYTQMLSDPDFEDHILGHDWQVVDSTPVTCTAEGVTNYHCAECGEDKTETVPALGHKYGNWEYASGNTAKSRTCATCGNVETVAIATSNNPSDYWTGWSKNKLSRLANNPENIQVVGTPTDDAFTMINNNGDLEVSDTRADVKVKQVEITPSEVEGGDPTIAETWVDGSMVVAPVTRIMSKYANQLNGFTATVYPVASPSGVYNSALAFVWTTTPENYDGYREYSVETYQDNYNWARYGFMWNTYVPNQEYSFFFTVLDQLFVDNNNDNVINGSGEIELGTRGDNVYDAVLYSAVTKGQVWNSGYAGINAPMADGVTVALTYGANGFLWSVNGGSNFVAQNMLGSQLLTDGYYFGIASNALDNNGSSSFVVTDVCGQNGATYIGGTPGEVPVHVHSYEDRITTAAKCTVPGVKTYTCFCGDSYTEEIAPIGHNYKASSVTEATCTTGGYTTYMCSRCNDKYNGDNTPALGHNFGDWAVVTEATATTDGLKRRECTRCDTFEEEVIPATGEPEEPEADVYVHNYIITFKDAANISAIRIASGAGLTSSQIKNAPDVINISATVIAAGIDENGNYNYELPSAGDWSVWYKLKDGNQIVVNKGLNNTEMTQEVSLYGPTLTIKNLYGVKDAFVKKGVYETYADVKNGNVFRLYRPEDLANKNYKYGAALPGEGTYTLLVRYNDTTRENLVIHFDVTVTHPTVSTNGRLINIGNINDIKVIRVVPGTYATSNAIKNAAGVRNFPSREIAKLVNADGVLSVLNVVNADGSDTAYSVAVEYKDMYCEIHNVTVHKKVPTYTITGRTITFHNLDGMTLFRYAPGKYSTGTAIKNAPGSIYYKTVTNDTITVENMPAGKNSFLVQYDDSSENIFVLDIQ